MNAPKEIWIKVLEHYEILCSVWSTSEPVTDVETCKYFNAANLTDPVFLAENGLCRVEWISVDDRLPEVGYGVLILTSYGKQATAYYGGVHKTYGWVDLMRVEHTYGSVTHWMTLPSPPEERE